jgi:predicted nuclease of predicted toxin-antitoxin system
MNLSPKMATQLSELGMNAMHWSSLGKPNAKDVELLSYARTNGYVILTSDIDFAILSSQTKARKPSIALVRLQEIILERDAPLIYAALIQHEGALANGAIVSIDLKRTRVRMLPVVR